MFGFGLTWRFRLPVERCIFVAGNHDLRDLREANDWQDKPDGLKDGERVEQSGVHMEAVANAIMQTQK